MVVHWRADELIDRLRLTPHPEGGHYREVYRSALRVEHQRDASSPSPPSGDARSAVTCIWFLLRAGEVSRWHVVASDEVWTFIEGDSGGLELITFDPRDDVGSKARVVQLGAANDRSDAMHVVPAGVWQCARPLGDYALVSCAVAPGFEFEDFAFVSDLSGHRSLFDDGPLRDYAALL